MTHLTPTDTTDELHEALDDETVQQIKQKSVSGAISYFARTMFLNGIGLVTSLILSAIFIAEDFAVYGYVLQFIGLLVFFSDVGLAASLIQKKTTPTRQDYQTAFTVQQGLSWLIVLACVGIAASGVVQRTVGEPGVWILLALGFSFPLASFKTISSIMLERELSFGKLVLPQIVEQLIFNGLLIGLALSGMGVMAYAYAILARSIIGTLVMFWIRPWPVGLSLNRESLRTLLSYGVKFQLNDFLARIKDNLFFLILPRFMSTAQYGYISWSKQWSMYPYNLTVGNVMAITFPTFSRLQHDTHLLKRAIEKSLFFITLLIFPLLIGMSVFIWPLTQVVSQYTKWQPAVMSFILFTMSIGWSALSSPATNALNAIGQVGATLKLMIMWTVLTWVVTPICLHFFGFNGVGIASILISVTSLVPIFMLNRVVNIEVWDQIWRQLLAAGVMAAVGVLGVQYWTSGMLQLLLGMGLCSVSYAAIYGIVGHQKLAGEIGSLRKK